MKKKLQEWKTKKEDGTAVEAMLVFAVAFLIFMAVLTILLSAFSNINSRWQARQIAREYLLVAETQGYLTQTDIKGMTDRLADDGLYSIDTTGTTVSKVPYGSKITVQFTAKIKDHALLGSAGGSWKAGTKENTVSVYRQSTAKQQE